MGLACLSGHDRSGFNLLSRSRGAWQNSAASQKAVAILTH
jgi:hypothetical protein